MLTNQDYVIDSRDINRRIAELQAMSEPMSFEAQELKDLLALRQQGEPLSPQWQAGVTLLRADVLQEVPQVSFAGTAYVVLTDPLPPRRTMTPEEREQFELRR